MLPAIENTVEIAPTREHVRITTRGSDRPSVTKRWLFAFGLAVVTVFAGTLPCDRASATETSGGSQPASGESAGDRSAAEKSAVEKSDGEKSDGSTASDDEQISTGEADESREDKPRDDEPREKTGDSRGEAGTLSVAPSDHIEYPEDRPEWIDAENDLDSPLHRWIVRTPPCETREECEDLLAVMFLSELRQYGRALTGSPFADDVSVEEEKLLESLVARRYDGTLTQGNLPAYESALELRIGPEFQARIRRQVRNGEVRQRIGAVGVMSAGGLALVMMLAGATAGISRHRAARGSGSRGSAA